MGVYYPVGTVNYYFGTYVPSNQPIISHDSDGPAEEVKIRFYAESSGGAPFFALLWLLLHSFVAKISG